MRRLTFGTEQVDKDRFDVLYGGICVSQRGIARTELVTFNRLMEKLENVAEPIENPPKDAVVLFELGNSGGVVELEEAEFTLMNEFHNTVKWAPQGAKKAQEMYNWLANIPEDKVLTVVK